MSKQNGHRFNLDTWRQDALRADKKTWRAAYDQFFRETLKRTPQWRDWEQSGRISLNERQSIIWDKIRRREGTFLDVGCGPGFLVGALLGNGKDAYGCDCSQEAINFARNAASCMGQEDHYFRMDLEELPGSPKTYDTVVCMDVLEHLVSPEHALNILWDKVADGGFLYVTIPKRPIKIDPQHLQEFSQARIEAMVDVLSGVEGDYPATAHQVDGKEGTSNWVISAEKRPVDLKFVMITGSTTETDQANEITADGRLKTGVFNWMRLFRGFATQAHQLDNPQDYDVIHIQLSGTNFDAPRQIRQKLGPDSDTKLVVNLDYAPEFWYMYPPYPRLLMDQLRCADYIMSVEPHASAMLAELTGRPVYTVPHPADIDAIERMRRPLHERQDALVMLHRDNQDYQPYWMLEGSGLKTCVIGRLHPCGNPAGSVIDYPALMYDYVHEGYLGGEEAVGIISNSVLAVDCYTHHVCGRSQIEMAALGVPCVGYPNVWAQIQCFPALTVKPGDVLAGREAVRRLVTDKDWYSDVSQYAIEKVRMFDYDHARERYLTMLGRIDGDSRPFLPSGITEVRPEVVREMEQTERAVADTAAPVLV